MEIWVIVLGLTNLILLFFALIFFIPKKKINLLINLRNLYPYILIIFGIVIFQFIEVNFIDNNFTNLIGHDFANEIRDLEGDKVFWFSQIWTPILVYFFVFIYIAVYTFTLWFSPLYFLITNDKKSMKTLTYGLLIIYIIALPFYLIFPVNNIYIFYNINSALESVIPSIESFFYSTTTQNNSFPSLHTAITILIAYSVSLTDNKKLKYFSYFVMISVIISVIYLSIHWITDVLAGGFLSVGVILLLRKYLKEPENELQSS